MLFEFAAEDESSIGELSGLLHRLEQELGEAETEMLLAGEKSIREVIAFAKTTAAVDLMAESPSDVDRAQLEQLGIQVKKS